MFYCREKELSKLNKRYYGNEFECIVIYGRRRVGKTALINEFCKDKPAVFFSALNSSAKENLEMLSRTIYEFKNPGADSSTAPVYRDFDDAFAEITRLSENDRLIFVIDEYPYLAKADNSVSSRLQHIIDHMWSKSKLFLILCGSSMSFMEYQILFIPLRLRPRIPISLLVVLLTADLSTPVLLSHFFRYIFCRL